MTRLICAFSLALFTLSLPVSAENKSGWTLLFDGDSTEHWRAFQSDSFPDGGWKVEDGVLTSIASGDRVDIITKERFTNFEFEVEWRVGEGGNSGIFYRVSEKPGAIWHAAPEYQILDDRGVKRSLEANDSLNPIHSAGSLYDLVAPHERRKLNPAGEFNKSRVVIQGNRVEHWLNGVKIVAFDFEDPALQQKIAESKFAPFKSFGQVANGHIALQHHGDNVGFRNIRIRELPSPAKD